MSDASHSSFFLDVTQSAVLDNNAFIVRYGKLFAHETFFVCWVLMSLCVLSSSASAGQRGAHFISLSRTQRSHRQRQDMVRLEAR